MKCIILLPYWSQWNAEINAGFHEYDSSAKNCEFLIKSGLDVEILVIANSFDSSREHKNTFYVKSFSMKEYIQRANDIIRSVNPDLVHIIERPYCLHHLSDIPVSILITNPDYDSIDFENHQQIMVIGCSYDVLRLEENYFQDYCVIRPGFDFNKFDIKKEVVRENKIIFASRMSEIKGIFILHDIISKLDIPIEYYGICKDELTAQRIRKNKMDWRGEAKDLPSLFSSAKICMTASIFYDPFPKTAIESQLCGCIFLGSNRGGIKEELPSDQIFDPFDHKDMRNCILRNLNSDKTPGQNRAWAMKFGIDKAATQYKQAWERLLSLPKTPKVKHKKIEINKGDSLYSLLGSRWTEVYFHDVNKNFRKIFPEPSKIKEGFFLRIPE